jgi:fumarate reductase (CoM/CoB) subunit B
LNTEAREVLGNVQNNCNGCQACSSACPLLTELGGLGGLTLPEIAEQVAEGQPSEQVRNFIQKCTLCGRCTRHCPSAVDVPAMVTAARTVLAESTPAGLELYRPVWVDYDWNIFTIYRDTYHIDYRDLIKDKCEALFFPGCTLPCYAPELTRASFEWLSERSGDVGLLPACCGIPLVQMGAAERAAEYMAALRQTVNATGARRIVTVCPTCHCHLQGQPLPAGTEVVSIYQLMVEDGVHAPVSRGRKITFHDSCPERRVKLGGYMRELLGDYDVVEMVHSGAESICCGSGGLVGITDPAACSRQAEVRMAEFRQVVVALCVTSCVTCALTLSAVAPGKVRHILELVFNLPVDYAEIQRRSEAMWQGEPGKVNFRRLAEATPSRP